MTYLIIHCIIFLVVTYLLIRMFIELAPKLGFVDIPNERSSHTKTTPRGAGIVFGFTYLLGLIFFDLSSFNENIYVYLAILIIYLCGLIDDKFGLTASMKLIFIILASIIVYFQGYQLTNIGEFFHITLNLGYLALPATIFVIVALTNAVNLSDGLDGLAGSLSIIILTAIFCIGYSYQDTFLMSWSGILISVLLAFLYFNWYPAKVFMGDSGSLLLGFMIAILSIKALDYISSVSILFLAAIPVLDTLVVFRRRIQRKQSPFKADKNHLHHILNNMKQNKKFTVNMLLTIQFVFSCMFLQLHNKGDELNLLIFFSLFLVFFNLFDPRVKRRNNKFKLRKKYKKQKEKNKLLQEKLENIQV